MRRSFGLLIVMVILVLALLASSCQSSATTPASSSPATVATASQTTAASPVASQTTSETAKYGGTLTIISRSDLGKFGDPYGGTANYTRHVGPAIEFMVRHDSSWNPVPGSGLLESWDTAPDGSSITLHLRKGIKFQDGTDFNAEAVKYNFVWGAPKSSNLQNISSYDVIDQNTLKLNLKKFDANLLSEMGHALYGKIHSPAAIEIKSSPETAAVDHTVGTGPFKFVSWKKDVNVKFEKWADYWQKGKPYLDAIEFKMVADPVTSLISFQKGEGQIILDLTPREASELEAKGFRIQIATTLQPINPLVPDGANPKSPFFNKKVREAVEYAIDKAEVVKGLGYGYYKAAGQFAQPEDATYVKGLTPRSYNPDKAKQLLTEAGFPTGFKTKLIAQQGFDKDVLVTLQTYLKAVGIEAELDIADAARFMTLTQTGWDNGLMVPGIGMTMGLAGMFRYFGIPGGPGGGLVYHTVYRPDGWQGMMEAASTQPDDAKRMEQIIALRKIIFDESMAIPLWTAPMISALDQSVQDSHWYEGHQMYYDAENIWLKK